MDPFAILGIPRRFCLDRKDVESKHRELSRALHPDKYAAAAAAERRMSLGKAVEVNEAWRVVREPVARAEAIFVLEGLGNSVGETREPKPTPAFLMEVMEAREALDDAASARDVAAIAKAVEQAKSEQASIERSLGEAIDGALEKRDFAALEASIPLLGRLRYATRLLEEATAIEDRIAGL